MQTVIKIITLENVEVDHYWHFTTVAGDTNRTLCGFTIDEGCDNETVEKTVKRGGVTCPYCIEFVRAIKRFKL